MDDLRGKKSCHTGFGRNVGYNIPLTRLRHVLKFSVDPTLSSVEKELKALSDFFAASCIVGTYSSDPDINRNLSKKFVLYPRLVIRCFNVSSSQSKSTQTYVNCARILQNVTIPIIMPAMTEQSDV